MTHWVTFPSKGLTSNAYNMGPWNNGNTFFQYSKWVWNIASAASNADVYIYLWFYGSFYYAGVQNTGTIYIAADNVSTTYVNGGTTIGSTVVYNSLTLQTTFIYVVCNK